MILVVIGIKLLDFSPLRNRAKKFLAGLQKKLLLDLAKILGYG